MNSFGGYSNASVKARLASSTPVRFKLVHLDRLENRQDRPSTEARKRLEKRGWNNGEDPFLVASCGTVGLAIRTGLVHMSLSSWLFFLSYSLLVMSP